MVYFREPIDILYLFVLYSERLGSSGRISIQIFCSDYAVFRYSFNEWTSPEHADVLWLYLSGSVVVMMLRKRL